MDVWEASALEINDKRLDLCLESVSLSLFLQNFSVDLHLTNGSWWKSDLIGYFPLWHH